ncbi:MAG: CRTAC1 family protein [Armatimonadetes bacterium]|nr:CRTAC1 family protein [Armatimonadota bacterium]MDE2207373.1 CRTAC1 family protein [Armatimonadota bacterium]
MSSSRAVRPDRRQFITGVGAAALAAAQGCGKRGPRSIAPEAVATPFGITFADVTEQAGVHFNHVNGAFGLKWLPETMGSGVAWIDYDGDGFQDLFLVNSRNWTPAELASAGVHAPAGYGTAPDGVCALYRNNGDGTFTDVTARAGLNVRMYGMGVAVGDYDNDGFPDLYVTGLGRNYLFHNNGRGGFTEVAAEAGVADGGWSTSAAWVDYDRDGHLDLLVCHYVQWTPSTDIPCPRNGERVYCTPQQYAGAPLALYHNNGKGRFTNIAGRAGLLHDSNGRSLQGKSLGVAVLDYNNDGWPDIAIANDTEPNYLFRNGGNGTFAEVGVREGIAFPDNGTARGAMGIDAADYDRCGRPSLIIGNFSNQMLSLYHNDGRIFRDVAAQAGIGTPSLLSLSFGCFFADLDGDGWNDIFVANGHIDDTIQQIQREVTYAESPLLFRNLCNGQFENVSRSAGADIARPMVARGAAYADYMLRGVPDIAVSTNNGAARLLRNSGKPGHNSLRLELTGTRSNRSAIGAAIAVHVGSGVQRYRVRSGSSYCSQSELPVTVGLGTATQADTVAITWPSGAQTTLANLPAAAIYEVVEGRGVVSRRAFGQGRKQPAA